MSLAAGNVSRAQTQRAYFSAARSNSTRSVRASRHGRARVRQRTGAKGGRAPPKMRFLVGLARPRAMVSRHTIRPHPDFGLQTRFEHAANVDLRVGGNLDEFGAAHLPVKSSRCRYHQRRPEIMLRPASTRFFSRQLAEQLRRAAQMTQPVRHTKSPTACPTGRTPPRPSGATLQWRPSPSGGQPC